MVGPSTKNDAKPQPPSSSSLDPSFYMMLSNDLSNTDFGSPPKMTTTDTIKSQSKPKLDITPANVQFDDEAPKLTLAVKTYTLINSFCTVF
jgi:hypothetical protein